MRTMVFSTRRFDREFLSAANAKPGHELVFVDASLTHQTAPLAQGCGAVCAFVNDILDGKVLQTLHAGGTRLIALRSAGFNHVDVTSADALGLTVLRVPAYSPYAVAEHTVALMLALNRKLHRAHQRVREHNFALDGLMGFDMHGKTVGVVGTGKIGTIVARIMLGFGCDVLAYDVVENPACIAMGVRYVPLSALWSASDVVTLHAPLTPRTHHLVDQGAIEAMKRGVMLVNTSRGGLVDTAAVIGALKGGQIGALALDVYEEEGDLFFRDLSDVVLDDDVFARLTTFPNVLITAHQAFFTREAVTNIAETTIRNISDFAAGTVDPQNVVTAALVAA